MVTITSFCCDHSGDCKPSTQEQIMCRSRSENYISSINETAIFTLCNMLKFNNGNLSNTTIKSVLQPIWPINKNISKSDIFNLRLKI